MELGSAIPAANVSRVNASNAATDAGSLIKISLLSAATPENSKVPLTMMYCSIPAGVGSLAIGANVGIGTGLVGKPRKRRKDEPKNLPRTQ